MLVFKADTKHRHLVLPFSVGKSLEIVSKFKYLRQWFTESLHDMDLEGSTGSYR